MTVGGDRPLSRFAVGVTVDPQQLLYVYELKGGTHPPAVDMEGLLGVWPEGEYTYLFFSLPAEAAVAAFLDTHPDFHLTGRYRLRYGDWQDLAEGEPFHVGPFTISTRWEQGEAAADGIRLLIDPGVMFGSGLHPTTRGCLRALSLLYPQLQPARVLDLGTGTGILAIAAAKLGSTEVEAVDINPLAVSTAAANCRRNNVEEKVRVRLADARADLPSADLLCLNIHLDFLRTFLPRPEMRGYGRVILSGFLQEHLEEVISLLPEGSRLEAPPLIERGWATLIVANHLYETGVNDHGRTEPSI
jgi:ribosomal protein L11 methyltransferase